MCGMKYRGITGLDLKCVVCKYFASTVCDNQHEVSKAFHVVSPSVLLWT